jgi:histone-lysine N-methyltransferase SETMAR
MTSAITGDECWLYGYDSETKQISSQWKTASSRPKKARQMKSSVKNMLIAFFDTEGLVHHEYVPRGQTVNKEFYKTVPQRPRDAVRRHRPEKWRSGNWILHHDKAPAHRAITTNEFLVEKNIPSLSHPPYSPDLAPCDFLFPQLKKTMKGRRFDYNEEIEADATKQLRAITKTDTQRCFWQWQERWNKCIQAHGHYFKGDKTSS